MRSIEKTHQSVYQCNVCQMQIPGAVSVLLARTVIDYADSKATFHVAPPPPFERASNIREQAVTEAKGSGEKMTPALLSRITSKLYREDRKAELKGLVKIRVLFGKWYLNRHFGDRHQRNYLNSSISLRMEGLLPATSRSSQKSKECHECAGVYSSHPNRH